MGTRGLYGFKEIKGRDDGVTEIGIYSHSDSYPKFLGDNFLSTIRNFSVKDLKKIANNIVVIDQDEADEFTESLMEEITEDIQGYFDYFCNLEENNEEDEEFGEFEESVPVVNSIDFKDSSFCEWSYFFNFKTNEVEIYQQNNLLLTIPHKLLKNMSSKEINNLCNFLNENYDMFSVDNYDYDINTIKSNYFGTVIRVSSAICNKYQNINRYINNLNLPKLKSDLNFINKVMNCISTPEKQRTFLYTLLVYLSKDSSTDLNKEIQQQVSRDICVEQIFTKINKKKEKSLKL